MKDDEKNKEDQDIKVRCKSWTTDEWEAKNKKLTPLTYSKVVKRCQTCV